MLLGVFFQDFWWSSNAKVEWFAVCWLCFYTCLLTKKTRWSTKSLWVYEGMHWSQMMPMVSTVVLQKLLQPPRRMISGYVLTLEETEQKPGTLRMTFNCWTCAVPLMAILNLGCWTCTFCNSCNRSDLCWKKTPKEVEWEQKFREGIAVGVWSDLWL